MLQAKDLAVGYGAETVARALTFDVQAGEILAVIGHNGSGKSTLVKTILGIESPQAGALTWTGGTPPQPIGYLGQLTDFDRRFPMRVCDLVETGGWSKLGFFDAAGAGARLRAGEAIARVGLNDIATLPLHKLSAGQLQRALFARTMVQDAQVIILDEPFAAVDQNTEADLMDHVLGWVAEGRSVIMVLHNLSTVLHHCARTLLLGRGTGRFGPSRTMLNAGALVEMGYLAADQARWLTGSLSSVTGGGVTGDGVTGDGGADA